MYIHKIAVSVKEIQTERPVFSRKVLRQRSLFFCCKFSCFAHRHQRCLQTIDTLMIIFRISVVSEKPLMLGSAWLDPEWNSINDEFVVYFP